MERYQRRHVGDLLKFLVVDAIKVHRDTFEYLIEVAFVSDARPILRIHDQIAHDVVGLQSVLLV